jgi:hypothetical protein
VATLCTHCGTALEDDARYCKICGTLIPSHPFSPASASFAAGKSEAYENTTAARSEKNGTSLRQQSSTSRDEPPAWMTNLEGAARHRNKTLSGALAEDRQDKPSVDAGAAPRPRAGKKTTHVTELPTAALPSPDRGSFAQQQTAPPGAGPSQEDVPPAAASPVRELRVKVWDQKEPAAPADDFEDLPTRSLTASPSEIIVQYNSVPSPERKAQGAQVDGLESFDTERLAAQAAASAFPPQASPRPLRGTGWQADVLDRPISAPGQPPFAYARPGAQPVQGRPAIAPAAPARELSQTPPRQSSVAPFKQRESAKPLLFVLIALVLLIVAGGAGAWLVIYQPFSVPNITQPQRTFSDQQLGLSLLYPSSWQVQKDRGSAAFYFFDSSHTAQVSIVVSPANGSNSGQYMQQEAAHIGLTAQKAGPALTLAGASWQQLQGSVQQRGANYSGLLLVTAHNFHFFAITFLAPQTIFVQEDQIVFSGIRSSLQFLA